VHHGVRCEPVYKICPGCVKIHNFYTILGWFSWLVAWLNGFLLDRCMLRKSLHQFAAVNVAFCVCTELHYCIVQRMYPE